MVGASYSHLRMKNPTVNNDFQEEIIDGIRYVWFKTCSYKNNGIKRIMNVLQFINKIKKNSSEIADKYKPDIVISSSTYPMDTYPAQMICKKSGAVLIHEVHDMWPICPMELYGLSARNPLIKYIQKAEDSFCKNADGIVSIQPCAENYYLEHGMNEGNFFHIPNGVVKEDWCAKLPIPNHCLDKLLHLRNNNEKIICFFGSHTKSYALNYLLDAAKKCEDLPIGFLLVGDGIAKAELIQMSRALGLKRIEFCDPIPKKSIPTLLELVDAIYVGAINNRMFEFGSCMNKTYDAMMSGQPLIYANPAPNNYVLEFDCGFNAKAEDSNDLARAIREFARTSEDELKALGDRAQKAVLDHFEYEGLSNDFLSVMYELEKRREKNG